MDSEVEACAECSRTCLLIHRKHDPSVIVCSFFKVMYGKHFVDVVTVPPRFARLASLVAQETYLEDSSGRKWNVILSDFNGSVAIGKGWNRFVVDHGIQLGDFVVFHYIRGSHFVVQTYGTHGCEKLSLSGENAYQNKTAKTTEYSVATNVCVVSKLEIDDIRRLDDVDVVKERLVGTSGASSEAKTVERPKRVSTSDFLDDTQFIVNQAQAREADRDYLFDLSVFEMPNKNVNKAHDLQIQGYRCSQVFDALQKAQIGTGSNSIGAKECLTAEGNTISKHTEEFLSRKEYTPPNTCPRIGIPLSSNMLQKPVGVPCNSEFSVASATVKHEPGVTITSISGAPTAGTSLRVVQRERLSSNVTQKSISIQQKSEFTAVSDYAQLPGVRVGLVKQEPRQFSQNFCDNAATEVSGGVSEHNSEVSTTKEPKTNNEDLGENLNHIVNDDSVLGIIVEPEPVDPCDSSAPIAKIPCLVQPDSESFLELPDCLPLKSRGQAAKVQLRLVFLQDPTRRVWPVLYHRKYGLNVLASGWRAFREANNIQPGDECTLVVENMDEGRFLVQILHSERF